MRCDPLHNPGRGNEAEGASNKTGCAKTAAAIQAQIRRLGAFARNASFSGRENRWLTRNHAFDSKGLVASRKTIVTTQLSADLQQQTITARESQVGYLDGSGILTSPGAT